MGKNSPAMCAVERHAQDKLSGQKQKQKQPAVRSEHMFLLERRDLGQTFMFEESDFKGPKDLQALRTNHKTNQTAL